MVTKLSRKGQLVIPVELRRRYNLSPGTTLQLMDIGGEIVIIPLAVKNPLDEARGLLKGGRSTREILKAVRQEEASFERKKR